MSSADLKNAIDFIAKRVNQRKVSSKTGQEKQDSQARSDLEKHNGQIWVINEFQQAAIIEKRLNNPSFIEKAPPNVIEDVKTKKTVFDHRKSEINKALLNL